MEQLFEYLQKQWNIDLIIVALVFMSGLFQEKYIPFELSKDKRLSNGLKTLILSAIVGLIYAILVYYEERAAIRRSDKPDMAAVIPLKKYFVSYFAATSVYDMAVRPIRNWINKKLGNKEEPAP